LGRLLARKPDAHLELQGHADHRGTPAYNQALSERRVEITKRFLKDKILKNLKVVTLAQNRRVDITLSSTGQQSVRQFPFNAEDALTLLSPGMKK
jgi:outer membrane protein OmpA-like peptidoglycan-associated protein